MERRTFLTTAGLLTAGALVPGCTTESESPPAESPTAQSDVPASSAAGNGWQSVRDAFALSPDVIHMSALLVSTHPQPVREAIDRYRRELDANPVRYLQEQNNRRKQDVRDAAADYLGGGAADIALTDSTTMGIALVYHGLQLQPDDEILTTEHAYYATYEALRQVSDRTGARVRRIRLYDDPAEASADQIVTRITEAITPSTRALALTWVHSSTGVKLPLSQISEAVAEQNRGREDGDGVVICVDGVHAMGIEDIDVDALGCDFLMAGCHKWLFGPRGTGIVWGRPEAWPMLSPVIPSFVEDASWVAWAERADPSGPTTAERMSPGGFKAFEHEWAVADAFRFHQNIGKARVAERTHGLTRQLKEGLSEMSHVTLHTPLPDELSAGIVCFEVDGHSPDGIVDHLERQSIIATTTPYAVTYPRLTPSIYNTPEEVQAAVDAVAALG